MLLLLLLLSGTWGNPSHNCENSIEVKMYLCSQLEQIDYILDTMCDHQG
jgi:hypothetical protein